MSRAGSWALAGAGLLATAGLVRHGADRRAARRDPRHEHLCALPQGHERRVRGADGTEIHVEEFGDPDAPAVVLAHGWTCSLEFWTCQIQALAENHHVIAYDLRGHGHSDRASSGDYSIEALAGDMSRVLRATVRGDGRAVVAGHSMGAMTLVAMTEHHPEALEEWVGAAALINTGMGDLISEGAIVELPERLNSRSNLIGEALLTASSPLPQVPTPLTYRMIRHLAMGPTATPAEIAFCERLVMRCPRQVRAACGVTLATLDLHDAVGRLQVPATVIAGRRDRLTPPVQAERLLEGLPQGDLIIREAGHMMPVTHHELVSESIGRLAADQLTSPVAEAA